MAQKAAFVVIATGSAYAEYARELLTSMEQHLKFDYRPFIFTDHAHRLNDVGMVFEIGALGYPDQTLYRYHTMLMQQEWLARYDQLFYVDADMLFVKDVQLEDIASEGLTATLHPGFFAVNQKGTTEHRKESTAHCKHNTRYYCGGFQGGNAQTYLLAAKWMAKFIDVDNRNNITAVWHDESHWNRILADIPPAKVLTPSFCFPEDYDGGYGWSPETYPPILVAMDKRKRGNHPRAI